MQLLTWYVMPGSCTHMASNGRTKLVTAHWIQDALTLWEWDDKTMALTPLHVYYGEPFPDTAYPVHPDGSDVDARTRFHFSRSSGRDIHVAFCAGSDMVFVFDPIVPDVHIVDMVRRKHCGFLDLNLSYADQLRLLTTASKAPIGVVLTNASWHDRRHTLHVIDTCTMRVQCRIAVNKAVTCIKLSDDGTQLCVGVYDEGFQVVSLISGIFEFSALPVVASYHTTEYFRDVGVWCGQWCWPHKNRFQFLQDSADTAEEIDIQDIYKTLHCVIQIDWVQNMCSLLDGRMMLGLITACAPSLCLAFFYVGETRTAWMSACARSYVR